MSQSMIDRIASTVAVVRGTTKPGDRRKVALITGASSGLGAEMARQLAARGWDLALCARRLQRLEDLKTEIVEANPGARVEVRTLDVTDEEQVSEVFHAFATDFGGLDRIVVNAGVGDGAPVGKGKATLNRQLVMTNVVGALAQCEAAMEIFRAQKRGHLVVVASMAAMRGMAGVGTVYAASKAAVSALAEGIRLEMLSKPKYRIKVTTLYPGFIKSEMTEGLTVPFMAETVPAVREMVLAMELERPTARVPAWPWLPMGTVMRNAPLELMSRVGGQESR